MDISEQVVENLGNKRYLVESGIEIKKYPCCGSAHLALDATFNLLSQGAIATHPADPDFVLAASLMGEIYASEDAGDSWQKLNREFTEVGVMVWVPN